MVSRNALTLAALEARLHSTADYLSKRSPFSVADPKNQEVQVREAQYCAGLAQAVAALRSIEPQPEEDGAACAPPPAPHTFGRHNDPVVQTAEAPAPVVRARALLREFKARTLLPDAESEQFAKELAALVDSLGSDLR